MNINKLKFSFNYMSSSSFRKPLINNFFQRNYTFKPKRSTGKGLNVHQSNNAKKGESPLPPRMQ